MKQIYLIVEKSATEKEYEAYFRKLLKKYGASSPADLSDEQKKEFFNKLDKEFKSDKESGVKESREIYFNRMVRNRRYRKSVIEDYAKKDALIEQDKDGDEISHGAQEDDETSGEKHALVVEFPNEIRVEFVCKKDDIEKVKTRAQELHDEGMDPTEVAQKVEEEFPGCSYAFDKPGEKEEKQSPKHKDLKDEKDQVKKPKVESVRFADFVKGKTKDDILEASRQLKENREEVSRGISLLGRINKDLDSFMGVLENANPATKRRLLSFVLEEQASLSIINRLEENLYTDKEGGNFGRSQLDDRDVYMAYNVPYAHKLGKEKLAKAKFKQTDKKVKTADNQ
jgi:hypothetical protein